MGFQVKVARKCHLLNIPSVCFRLEKSTLNAFIVQPTIRQRLVILR